jgi:hypothetical protein
MGTWHLLTGLSTDGQDLQNPEPAFLLSTFPREGKVQIYFLISLLSNNHPHTIRTNNLHIFLNLKTSFLGTHSLVRITNTALGLRRKPSNAQKLLKPLLPVS